MAERLKAHAWKACLGETLTWVRIPLSPPPFLPPSQTVDMHGGAGAFACVFPVSLRRHIEHPLGSSRCNWAGSLNRGHQIGVGNWFRNVVGHTGAQKFFAAAVVCMGCDRDYRYRVVAAP